MRILVHEFFSGGGLLGQTVPASLAREGAAMRDALVADLAAIGQHQIVTTVDPRFPLDAPPGVEVVILDSSARRLHALMASADAVWLVAPETDRCLERLAARVERLGTRLLSSGSSAIREASDKARLPRLLAQQGVVHPLTRLLRAETDWSAVARRVGYPVVIKPRRGAGCTAVYLARDERELRQSVDRSRRLHPRTPLIIQRYVAGIAASVSVLSDGRRAVPLSLNAQVIHTSRTFSYCGGRTPLNHPLAATAIAAALRACDALPGLRGWVGVDLVLTQSEAIVIEVNPRLTTAYLGVRRALQGRLRAEHSTNIAAMALAACTGVLPAPPLMKRQVRFSADGTVVSTALSRSRSPRR